MSEFDFWFLELVVQSPVSFLTIIPYDQCIVPDDYQTPSNLTTNQIVDILFRLFQDGYLLAITPADLDSLDTHLINDLLTKAFIPSHEQIKTALDRENFRDYELYKKLCSSDLYFFLTEKGGKQWESWAKPKWNQFFRRCILDWESVSENLWNNSIPPHRSIISCSSQEIGEKIIAIEHLLDYPQSVRYYIENSAIWKKFTPWHPTYWKTLPCGYVVSYQIERVEVNNCIDESQELTEEKIQAREWYQKIVNWYTRIRLSQL